jgi:hypothetical protein
MTLEKGKCNPNPKHSPESELWQQPCLVCTGTDFEWGIVGGASYLDYSSDSGTKMITVRRCLKCDNLLTFIANKETENIYTPDSTFILPIIALIFFVAFVILLILTSS